MSERASRPLREVFLDRVIRIEAVQRERAAVTDEDAAGFFVDGRLLGDPELPDYRWSLDEPELFARRGAVQFLGVLGVGAALFPRSRHRQRCSEHGKRRSRRGSKDLSPRCVMAS